MAVCSHHASTRALVTRLEQEQAATRQLLAPADHLQLPGGVLAEIREHLHLGSRSYRPPRRPRQCPQVAGGCDHPHSDLVGCRGRRFRVTGIIHNPHTVIGRLVATLRLLDLGLGRRIVRGLFIASSLGFGFGLRLGFGFGLFGFGLRLGFGFGLFGFWFGFWFGFRFGLGFWLGLLNRRDARIGIR